MKQTLAGKSLNELKETLYPLPFLRAKQIYNWIIRGVNSFEQMTDIPILTRKELNERFNIFSGTPEECLKDGDTVKIVIALKDGSKIESVLLSDGKQRFTACISTQAGCPAGCVFCKTGSLGFKRNLDSTEIVEQFLFLRSLRENKTNNDEHLIDNIVVMGMGEPLLNLAALNKAIEFFNDKNGLNFSKRRITVSTCGICDSLFEIAHNMKKQGRTFVRLALSLTTADEPLREKLMPITVSNPLEKVHQALRLFQQNGGGRITLEVPLLGGLNTRAEDAASIAQFAQGLETVVNIIPWNPAAGLNFEGEPLRESTKEETRNFIKMLEGYGLKVTMRLHKGRSVMGACGQLGG